MLVKLGIVFVFCLRDKMPELISGYDCSVGVVVMSKLFVCCALLWVGVVVAEWWW